MNTSLNAVIRTIIFPVLLSMSIFACPEDGDDNAEATGGSSAAAAGKTGSAGATDAAGKSGSAGATDAAGKSGSAGATASAGKSGSAGAAGTANSTEKNTFTIKSYGTFTSPSTEDGGGRITQVTDKLQFAYVGSKGTAKADNGGGNIYFPKDAATGMYTIKVVKNGNGLAATECSLDMTGGVDDKGIVNVAQSGMVSLTVTGGKYKITFSGLPSLDQNMRADELSGNFTW